MITISPNVSWRHEISDNKIYLFFYFTYNTILAVTMNEGYAIGVNGQKSERFFFNVIYSKQYVRVNITTSQTTLKRPLVYFSFSMIMNTLSLDNYIQIENGVLSLLYFNGYSGRCIVSPKKAANITFTILRSTCFRDCFINRF